MAQNKPGKSSSKPSKPYPDFPLFPHGSGQWAKMINQKTHYFGKWADPQAALKRYLDVKDDLLAGRDPSRGDGLTVKEFINEFLTSKQRLVSSGELTARTLTSYDCRKHALLEVFGDNRHVETLRPQDFEELRDKYTKTHGQKKLTGDVVVVKMMFKYAYESDLIERPVKFGPNFKTPSRRTEVVKAGDQVITGIQEQHVVILRDRAIGFALTYNTAAEVESLRNIVWSLKLDKND